jgi:hypothetical protein
MLLTPGLQVKKFLMEIVTLMGIKWISPGWSHIAGRK